MNPVKGDFEAIPNFPPTGTGVPAKIPFAMQIGLSGESGSQPGLIFSQQSLVAIETPPIYILYQDSGFSSTQVFFSAEIDV